MKQSNTPQVCIVAIDTMWGAIEWILPLCKYLKDTKELQIVFVLFRHNVKDIFQDNSSLEVLVKDVSDNRCYDMSSFAPSWSSFILKYLRRFKKKPLSYGYKLWERLSWKVFSRVYIKKWIHELNPFAILKDNFGSFSGQFKVFLTEANKRGCSLIRFPSAPSFTYLPGLWIDLQSHDFQSSDFQADLNIVDNTWDADYLEANNQKSIVVGTPKFDASWIKYLEKRSDLTGIPDVQADKYILILLKNEKSAVFDHVDFTSLLREIIKTSLMFEGFSIILKPHPRQDIELLQRIVHEYKSTRISVSNQPSFNLINKAHIIVAMPSGVILDALIAGKPVIEYFHFNELERALQSKFKLIPKNFLGGMSCLDSNGRATSVFRAKGLVAPADDPESLEDWLTKFHDNAKWEGTSKIRNIFPSIPMKKAADTIMAFAG